MPCRPEAVNTQMRITLKSNMGKWMPIRTFESLKPEYASLWASCQIRPAHKAEVQSVAKSIMANRSAYEKIAQRTGVPWFVTGIIHAMECTQFPKLTQHLHNGDRLDRKTRLVPAGRPAGTWPPEDKDADLFVESAVDALTMKGKEFDKIKDWSIERIAFVLESYNGWGYRNRGVASAYLWSYTNQYRSGKYVADHVWSSTAVSEQCGGMALLKALHELDASLTSTQQVAAAAEPERAWAKAEDAPVSLVSVAKTSLTVRSLIVATFMAVINFFEWLFGFLPDVVTDAQGLMAPVKTLGSMLKVNIVGVSTSVTLVCIAIGLYRHADLKRLALILKGENVK